MNQQKVVLKVDTMTCNHCTNYVQNTINNLNGIVQTDMSLADGTATVTYNPDVVSKDEIVVAINETHYKVSSILAEA